MLPFLRNLQTLYAWLLVALTDLAVVVPWILLFYRAIGTPEWHTAIPGVWLGLAVYAAASLWEAGDRSRQDSRWRRTIAMGVGLVASYLSAYYLLPGSLQTGLLSGNAAWSFVLPAGYLWYQGTLAITEGLDYDRLFSRYPWQVVGAVFGIILLTKFGGAADRNIQVLLYWSVVLLLAGGMIALVTARERLLRASQASYGEKGSGSERQSRWIAITVLVLLVLTLGASNILSVDRMVAITSTVGHWISAIYQWFASVVYLILYRWMMLVGPWLERFTRWLLYLSRKRKGQEPGEMETGEPDEPQELPVDDYYDPEPLMRILRVAVLIAIIVGACVAAYRMSRRGKGKPPATEEEFISLGFWSNLWADLKGLLKPSNLVAAATVAAAEVLDPRDPRTLFRRLQAWGERLGRPRQPQETPNAYQGALSEVRPAQAGAALTVTALYNKAKYGRTAPGPREIDAAAEAVAGLEAAEAPPGRRK
ncbi:MAG TPA: DUF4129 domain-containing protein [Symbiobacteriaceae bacterium]|nr:DUF4129 domain-containing protein [Symbiobacteriaceae bacterium]